MPVEVSDVPEYRSTVYSIMPLARKSFHPRSRLTRSLTNKAKAALTTSTARPPGAACTSDYDFKIADASSDTVKKVRAHRNRHAFIDQGKLDILEPHADAGISEFFDTESEHDESWHDHYYELVDNYKRLVK